MKKFIHAGEQTNLSASYTGNGVLIEWQLATSQFCQNNINYTLIVETADHSSNNSFSVSSIVFGMTRTTIPLQLIPDQVYTVQVTALVNSHDSITSTRNFTISGPSTIGTNIATKQYCKTIECSFVSLSFRRC